MTIDFDVNTGNVKLKSVSLIEKKLDGLWRFYLEVTYTYTDKYKNEHELTFHKVELPIRRNCLPMVNSNFCEVRKVATSSETIDLGFGDLPLQRNADNVYATDHITKYHCKEMTIEEIESKLGYKIKIVGEKGE